METNVIFSKGVVNIQFRIVLNFEGKRNGLFWGASNLLAKILLIIVEGTYLTIFI